MPAVGASLRRLASRLPGVPPTLVRQLSIASLVGTGAIVLTGAAVRVTGSGLGCADWPNCMKGQLTPPLQFHSLMEFGNRMVTVALVVVIGVTFLATLLRRPPRRDLMWLSGGLVAGVFVEAVIGGIVVYSKLNPYLVMVHFLATLLLLVDAVVLVHRSSRDYSKGPGRLLVPPLMLWLSRGLVLMTAIVMAAGSATTGAAPDAGGATGQLVAKRIPYPLRNLAELHADLALFLIGLAISLAVALHTMYVPERIRKASRLLVIVFSLQAVVGYSQYFSHLPAGLVELHELGATVLVIGVAQYYLALTHHAPDPALSRLSSVPGLAAPDLAGVGAPAVAGAGGIGAGVGGARGAGLDGASGPIADATHAAGSGLDGINRGLGGTGAGLGGTGAGLGGTGAGLGAPGGIAPGGDEELGGAAST